MTAAAYVAFQVVQRGRSLLGSITSVVRRLAPHPGSADRTDSDKCLGEEHAATTDRGRPAGGAGTSGHGTVRAKRPSPGGPTPAVPHVLLVDDDPPVRSSLELLLHIEGYRVTAVASCAEARCRIVDGARPDLLVADYRLGGGETGLEVIDMARQALGTPLKALLMTGDTSALAQELPPDPLRRIATKPFAVADLLALVEMLLGPDAPKARPMSLRHAFPGQGLASADPATVPVDATTAAPGANPMDPGATTSDSRRCDSRAGNVAASRRRPQKGASVADEEVGR